MQPTHVEQLRVCRKRIPVVAVLAEYKIVDVHLFGDPEQRRARELRGNWNACSIERIQTILAADNKHRSRLHALP